MAKSELPQLSESQLEIMNVVWEQGTTTVGEIWKALAERRSVSRNTVSTMVTRLEEKGWLRHRESGGTFLFTATQPREKVLPKMVKRLVDAAFQGSAEELVLSLIEGGKLSSAEAERIKAMIDKAELDKREKK